MARRYHASLPVSPSFFLFSDFIPKLLFFQGKQVFLNGNEVQQAPRLKKCRLWNRSAVNKMLSLLSRLIFHMLFRLIGGRAEYSKAKRHEEIEC